MTNDPNFRTLDISRRGLLRRAARLAGGGALVGVGLAASSASAATKMAQALAHYQTTPKGASRCDKCAHWQAPSSCQLVDGKISPTGWCVLFAPKPPG